MQRSTWRLVVPHLGGLAAPVALPLVVYLAADADDFALRWHAREAFGFQLLAAIVLVPLQVAGFVGFVRGVMAPPGPVPQGLPASAGIPLLLFTVLGALAGVATAFAALRAHAGDTWSYPVALRLLGRDLPPPPPASAGPPPVPRRAVAVHLAAITLLGGVVVPWWVRRRATDPVVRREAASALAFQLLVIPATAWLMWRYTLDFVTGFGGGFVDLRLVAVLFPLWYGTIGLSLAAAIQVNRGRRWRYPVRLPILRRERRGGDDRRGEA